ncbi:MFS general substrate transporter [Amylocystis lapponica]|nr:MFS general substrate transporter [Amylocystis lapponica]
MSSVQDIDDSRPQPADPNTRKGSHFWLSFIALIVSTFVSALDLTAISTALPTITDELHGGDNFSWVGSAFSLSSTAILPLSGRLADIFGRKPIIALSIAIFAVGSAIAGASQSMGMLIAARAIQGVGGGAILNLTEIIISDLVPLAERGMFQGLLGLTWALASGVGPPIGGAFAEKASWRWIFYMNLPLIGIAFGLVIFFLRVRTPEGSIKAKLARVDWIGNLIVIAGTTLAIVGLTWAGISHPWNSVQVLAPLIIGLVLIGCFFWYEARLPMEREPTIPWEVVKNRTSLGGFLATAIHGITSLSIFYYLPVYFQACFSASPIRSSVDFLPTTLFVAPSAMTAGIVVQLTGKYRPPNIVAWVFQMIGFGLLSMLKADSTTAKWVGYQIIPAIGIGLPFAATVFPVLAPLPVERNAAALAFFAFLRSFGQTWGITISSTILQNQLKKRLPAAFAAQFPEGSEIAYAAIPQIGALPEPLRTEVRAAFAASMAVIWQTMIGIGGLGLLTLFLLREVQMHEHTDESFGLHVGQVQGDDERTIADVVEAKLEPGKQ